MRNLTTNARLLNLLRRVVITMALFVLMFMQHPQEAKAYCSVSYINYVYYSYIYAVTFNGISNYNYTYNYSGGYTDYSSQCTNACVPGQTYQIMVYGIDQAGYTFAAKVFIDFNNNNSMDDVGESFYMGSVYYSGNLYYNIPIPSTAAGGKTRMRVFGGYYYPIQNYVTSCGTTSYPYYHECEEYSVLIELPITNDAGITGITAPTSGFRYDAPQPVTVTLKNFSTKCRLLSCDIPWSIGSSSGTYKWTGNLDTSATTNVTIIPSFNFAPLTVAPWNPIPINVRTANPQGDQAVANAKPDAKPGNDAPATTPTVLPILNDAGFVDGDAMIPIAPGVNNIQLRIKNYAPKPLSYVTVNYSVQGVPQPAYQALFGTPLAINTMQYVTAGTYNFGGGNIPFKIKAETANPNGVKDEFTPNDSGPGTFEVYKALPGGTYTIGLNNSDFRSLTEFTDFINFWGAAGPLTILFRPGTYQAGQSINPRGGKSYPMTFASITGSNYDVTLFNAATSAANNYLFNFDGFDNVVFKDLTLSATGTSYATIFRLLNGNDNVTLQNCVLNGKTGAAQTTDFALIYSNSNVLNNLIIHDNIFNGGSVPLWLESPLGVYSNNVQIYSNSFNNFTWRGVDVGNIHACQIHDNTFYGTSFNYGIYATNCSIIKDNRINGVVGLSSVANEAGIYVNDTDPAAEAATLTGNTVAGSNVNGIYFNGSKNVTMDNNIINLNSNGAFPTRYGLNLNGSPSASVQKNHILTVNANGLNVANTTAKIYYNKIIINTGNFTGLVATGLSGSVANNFVSAINCNAASFTTSTADVYYNTFYANNAQPYYAVKLGRPTSGNFKRNMAYNDGTGYAVVYTSGGTIVSGDKNSNNPLAAGFQSDQNNIFTKGTVLATFNGANEATLTNWKSATGMDQLSISVPAIFMSTTDLRLVQLNQLLYFMSPLGIGDEMEKVDIDGNVRSKLFYTGAHTIVPKIAIVQQPKEIVNCYGATNQMFIVVATIEYGGTLTYQWQKDGVDISGATSAILALPSLTHEMPGVYRCIINGNGGADPVVTNNTLLYTLRDTKITRQPENNLVDLGETAKFDLDVHVYENVPQAFQPKVQWYRDTVALKDNDRISGAQSSILTIRDINATDYFDNYKVVISGLCGQDVSNPISIGAKPKVSVKTEPDTLVEVCEGLSATFTVEAEVNIPIKMNYQWRYNGVPIDDDGHFMGTRTPVLKIDLVKASDAGDYDCVIVLDKNLDSKTTTVSKLTVKLLPSIIRHPDAKIIVKKDAQLKIEFEAQGFAPLMYAWFKDGTATGDSTAVLTKATAQPTDEGKYICKVWNECGEIWTKECAVSITTAIMMGADDVVAGGYTLLQNQPNPVGTTTTIGVVAPYAGNAVLSITDVFGRELKTYNLKLNEGLNNVEVNANQFNAGIYNYNLNVNGIQATRRMVVVK